VGHARPHRGPDCACDQRAADDERQATREAIMENLASYRNEDGSYTAPAATWGALAR
jgi:hypothetical protein